MSANRNGTLAAVHLLRSPLLSLKGKFYSSENGVFVVDAGFLEDAMKPWSTGERLMASLALDFSGVSGHTVSIGHLAETLDDGNWNVVSEAIRIARNGMRGAQ